MPLEYDRFDPTPCGFPRARVAALPPWTPRPPAVPRRAGGSGRLHFARGRYALRAAYELAGVGHAGALLAPAYHGRTMLDPAHALGAEIALYPVTPELHVDLDGLLRVAARCRARPAALLLTHYFGLPREIIAVARWCREHGVALIEDCSHALPEADPGAPDRPPMGATGQWAISSPYKFFPCPDGGWLWANGDAPLPAPPRPAGWVAELRAAIAVWRQWTAATRPAAGLPDTATIAMPPPAIPGREWREMVETVSSYYEPQDEHRAGLRVSRRIERGSDVADIARRRRARYAEWSHAVRGLPGARALFPQLPADVAPYMFPLLVDEPARLFYPLKHLGVPIWRWDDMAVSDCPVARRYRQGVFHLPCHQVLHDREMAWMVAALTAIARQAAPPASTGGVGPRP